MAIHSVAFFFGPGDQPQFVEHYSIDDLSWSGPLVVFFWPLFNLIVLLLNALVFLELIIYSLGAPVIAVLIIFVLVMIVLVFRKLILLKRRSVVQFSLTLAAVSALAPIVGYAFCIYQWF